MAHTAAITTLFLLYNNTNRFIVNFFFIAWGVCCTGSVCWRGPERRIHKPPSLAPSLTWQRVKRGERGWEMKKKIAVRNSSHIMWKKKHIGWNVQRRGGKIRGEEKGYCSEGGFRARPPGIASWNKQTAVRQTVLLLMGEKLAAPWMFPCTFHFLNAVLSVHHLTRQQCLQTKTRFICCRT